MAITKGDGKTFTEVVNAALAEAKRLGVEVPFTFGNLKRVARPDGTYTTPWNGGNR